MPLDRRPFSPFGRSPRLQAAVLAAWMLSGCHGMVRAAAAEDAAEDAGNAGNAAHVPAEASPSAAPSPSPSARVVTTAQRIFPLPGGLDRVDVFNSNHPEVVQETGILLSTLPQREAGDASVFLNHAFSGKFSLFSHHLTRETRPTDRVLFLGLIASNLNARSVTLDLTRGNTALTQPDAPFFPLPAVTPDPDGRVFAGPGDRISTDWLHDRSTVPTQRLSLASGQSKLVYSLPVPANTAGETPANGRSTLLEFNSTGSVYLTEVAYYAIRRRDGTFDRPTMAQYQQVIDQRILAGRREAPSWYYEPNWPVPEGFRYGRVCGVSRGDTWKADLFADGTPLPAPGERVGFPIASLYKKRLGTGQVQSAPMIKRYHDSAVQSQGNYGVTYDLTLHLANPDAAPRLYTLSLSSPDDVQSESGAMRVSYQEPPTPQVTFRGAIRLDWQDLSRANRSRYVHLVLRQGENVPAFHQVTVPASTTTRLRMRVKYPADATPPQLLTVTRVP